MLISKNLVVQFESVEGQTKKQLFCYFSDKSNAPYFSSDIVGSFAIEINGEKRLLWKSLVDIGDKEPLEIFELPTGVLKIYRLWVSGDNCPDISTYWMATFNDKPVALQRRLSMWRDEDYIYPNWVDGLKTKYTIAA